MTAMVSVLVSSSLPDLVSGSDFASASVASAAVPTPSSRQTYTYVRLFPDGYYRLVRSSYSTVAESRKCASKYLREHFKVRLTESRDSKWQVWWAPRRGFKLEDIPGRVVVLSKDGKPIKAEMLRTTRTKKEDPEW